MTFSLLPISSITILRPERQRRELQVDEGLKDSIKRNGVLVPVIVGEGEEGLVLIAGERRLEACKALDAAGIARKDPPGTIPARHLAELSLSERRLIELEENIKRKALVWQDEVRGVGEIWEIRRRENADYMKEELAEFTSLSPTVVSIYLAILPLLSDPRISSCAGYREAYNIINRRKERAAEDALEGLLFATGASGAAAEVLRVEDESATTEFDSIAQAASRHLERTITFAPEPIQPPLPLFDLSPVICADFLDWVKDYDGKRFSLIHCDFPYGVGVFRPPHLQEGRPGFNRLKVDELGGDYNDDLATYRTLVEGFCEALPRLLSISGHIMFWLDSRSETIEWTKEAFSRLAPSIKWTRFPLIWLKSDNAGIAASPNYEPRHIYETCLLGSQGDRKIIRLKSDAYASQTDRLLHPSAKPEPMLRHFMEMLVDEHSSVFDPTCGGGSALRAAESLGARRVLGLERDRGYADAALKALLAERTKRKGSELLGF